MRVYHQRWTREHRVARDDMPEIARSRVTKAKKHRARSIHVLAAPPPALPAVWRDFARTPALDHRFQARSSKVQGLVHRGYMHTRVCWITCEGMCRVWDSDNCPHHHRSCRISNWERGTGASRPAPSAPRSRHELPAPTPASRPPDTSALSPTRSVRQSWYRLT